MDKVLFEILWQIFYSSHGKDFKLTSQSQISLTFYNGTVGYIIYHTLNNKVKLIPME